MGTAKTSTERAEYRGDRQAAMPRNSRSTLRCIRIAVNEADEAAFKSLSAGRGGSAGQLPSFVTRHTGAEATREGTLIAVG
jgi:hypothetical protein